MPKEFINKKINILEFKQILYYFLAMLSILTEFNTKKEYRIV